MISKHGRHNCRNSRDAQRFVGFFLDCAFRVLIGWAGKLRSRGSDKNHENERTATEQNGSHIDSWNVHITETQTWRTNGWPELVFVLTQFHFGQWSILFAKSNCPVACQNFPVLATAHDCETGQWSSLPFCLPSLIVQWPARIFTFSYCAWLWNWLTE